MDLTSYGRSLALRAHEKESLDDLLVSHQDLVAVVPDDSYGRDLAELYPTLQWVTPANAPTTGPCAFFRRPEDTTCGSDNTVAVYTVRPSDADYVSLRGNVKMYVEYIDPTTFTPEVLCWGVRGIYRWGCQTEVLYSVAQHEFLCALWAYRHGVRCPRKLMSIAHHDAHEPICGGDIPSPIKRYMDSVGYGAVSSVLRGVQRAILESLGVPPDLEGCKDEKAADKHLAWIESRDLKISDLSTVVQGVETYGIHVGRIWGPDEAYNRILQLTNEIKEAIDFGRLYYEPSSLANY